MPSDTPSATWTELELISILCLRIRACPSCTCNGSRKRRLVKNRLHLDILTAEAEETIARLITLGATRLGTAMSGSEGGWWQVMADPEGNEFCVCRVE